MTADEAAPPRLLADIGGTNARFALAQPGGPVSHIAVMRAADHAGVAQAAEAYLAATGLSVRPAAAAFAVASPVIGDAIHFTNSPWSFSIAALQARLGLARLTVVNDFVAVALAVPHLRDVERIQIGSGAPAAGAPIAVLGPGTGLGVAALVPHKGGWLPVATEGGHATLAAADEREAAIAAAMRKTTRTGHLSAERALSGPGLVRLCAAIAAVDGLAAAPDDPQRITERAIAGTDALCRATLDMFCAMLGGFAGNLALSYGALGGVYIGGGIVPDFPDYLARSAFRARFEAKGRFRDYLAAIPTYVVAHPQPAFLGLARLDAG
jgi:glucokinase